MAGARLVASDIAPHREVAAFLPEGSVTFVALGATDEELATAILSARAKGPVVGALETVPTWRVIAERTLATYSDVVDETRASR